MRVRPYFALLFLLLCFSTENIAKSAIIDPRSINTSGTTIGAFEERLFFHQYKNESVSKRFREVALRPRSVQGHALLGRWGI